MKKNSSIEILLFEWMDELKFLFFPERWNQTFLDYSKNEIFTLFLIFRRGQVIMTEIADYLGVPLNTVTGIVSRLEKRGIIYRERDKEDKRIVVVNMTVIGKETTKGLVQELEHYVQVIISELTPDETELILKLAVKIFSMMKKESQADTKSGQTKKIRKISIE